MKIQELDPNDVVRDEAIATRKGELDTDHVELLCRSMMERGEAGQEPFQIVPGIVVPANKDGKFAIIAGAHRHAAVQMVNEAGGINGEPIPFLAYVVRSKEEADSLATGVIENEYRKATNVFDRADAMQKLIDLGKSQKEVAQIYGLSEGSVTQTLKAGGLDKKYVKAVLNGDLEADAAIIIADLPVDSKRRQEIFEESIRHRQKYDEIIGRKEAEDAKKAAAEEVDKAKQIADEALAAAKEAEKKAKEADKLAAKTKENDVEALEKARAEKAAADKAKKEAQKKADAAVKALDKAKQKKAKVQEQLTTNRKTKVSPEDVKQVAKSKGVDVKASPLSKNQFYTMLEVMVQDKDKPLPKSAVNIIAKIEAALDGEATAEVLYKCFVKNCVPDSK